MTGFSARPAILKGSAALAALAASLGLWGHFARLDSAIIAPGQIAVAQDRQVVQHADGGTIAELPIREGQPVAAGDLLLRLDGTALHAEARIAAARLDDLLTRRLRLEAERDDAPALAPPPPLAARAATDPALAELIDGQTRLFTARRDTLARQSEQLARRKQQLADQVIGIDAQIRALRRQVDLISREAANQRSLLARGLAPAARLLALERDEAGLQGRLGELAAQRAQTEGRATEIDLEILRLGALRREEALAELRDLAPLERETAQRLADLKERIARLDIRAPLSGTVIGLAVTTPRAVIRPAEPILHLVPQDRPLLVTASVPPLHVDELRIGQPVRLLFPAFPAADPAEVTGTLALVSADAFTAPDTGDSFYRVEIALPPAVETLIGGRRLLPGMPVEAFILTGSRSPLAYLLQPFTDYLRGAMREG